MKNLLLASLGLITCVTPGTILAQGLSSMFGTGYSSTYDGTTTNNGYLIFTPYGTESEKMKLSYYAGLDPIYNSPLKTDILTVNGTSGNIGVGTAAPAARFQVQTNSTGLSISSALRNQSGTNGNAVGIGFLNEASGDWWKAAIVHQRASGYGVGSLHFLVSNAENATTVGLSDARMTITKDGNVGIGITTPTSKFEVASGAIKIPGGTNTNNWPTIFNLATDGKNYIRGVTILGDDGSNVGIGTTNPTQKLSVNGRIRAKEIVVETSWADDVFTPGYRLASLSEIENHIDQKGHLPDVPSAKQIAENGVSVGETQALLLRKVEELTLHIISLNKQVQDQQKRLKKWEDSQVENP